MSASTDLDLRIAAGPAELPGLFDRVQAFAEAAGLPRCAARRLGVVREGLAANVAGYGGKPSGEARATTLSVRRHGRALHVAFEDDGRPFDPLGAAAPDTAAPVESRAAGGLGIHFVRTVARGLRHERAGALNRLSPVLDADA